MSVLQLKNVSRRFGKRRTLVRAVRKTDFTLKKGEIVLIMGPSGSGKTTLLSIMGGLLKPSTGRVVLKDIRLNRLTVNELSRVRLQKTGFVFQQFNLLESLTARENVEVPLNFLGVKGQKAVNKSSSILRKVRMHHRLNFYPQTLSAGEKQRVAIARALVNNPEIILADEPTGNLDSKSGKRVMKLFKKLVKKGEKSAIIVTHDNRIKKLADRIMWLEDGELSQKH
ncbi:ATP-binding cassette domain-containing protein [archaeon]|nr:ATP-binding cassette domain-containing protein [archaeon]